MIEVLTLDQLPERMRTGLAAGVKRFICPKCSGGHDREASVAAFSVVEQNDRSIEMIGLHCHRNSCGWNANVILGEGQVCRIVRQNVHEARVFTEPMKLIKKHGILYPYLEKCYDLPLEAYEDRWRFAEPIDNCDGYYRLVMPVRSPNGEHRGYQTRTFSTPKKVSPYKESAQPWLDWWLQSPVRIGSSLYVVEDQISACKLNHSGRNAVSLMGTNMPIDKAREIQQVRHKANLQVKLLLDPDAVDTAFKMQAKYAHMFQSQVIVLQHDPKDCSYVLLDTLLGHKHG